MSTPDPLYAHVDTGGPGDPLMMNPPTMNDGMGGVPDDQYSHLYPPNYDYSRRMGGLGGRRFDGLGERLEAVYVGHIAKEVSDEHLRKVLVPCGVVLRLMRSRDPVTDLPASFGFVEFESLEAVWRLTKLVHGLELAGSKLVVKCPQKTQELVNRWHSNRLFHLQKANPTWSPAQLQDEFSQEDDKQKKILQQIVKDVEEAIEKSRRERHADEEAKAARAAAMKARLSEMREATAGSAAKRARTTPASEKSAANNPDGIPQELIDRQTHRIENYRRRRADLQASYEHAKSSWMRTLEDLRTDALRRENNFMERWQSSIPSARAVLTLLRADLSGVQSTLSLTHTTTLGTSPLYNFDIRIVHEASECKKVDDYDVPLARSWANKVAAAREIMRDRERKDEKRDEEDEKLEKSALQEKQARRRAIVARQEQRAAELSAAASMVEKEDKETGVVGDRTMAEVAPPAVDKASVDWTALVKSGALESNGTLRQWLLKRSVEFVGADDAEDLADYVLEQLPPRSTTEPTRLSLIADMKEFLDDETETFVNSLWSILTDVATKQGAASS